MLIITVSVATIIFIFSLLFFWKRFRFVLNRTKQLRMIEWMNMSGIERNILDKMDKEKTMSRKRMLLSKIRKEYKDYVKKGR